MFQNSSMSGSSDEETVAYSEEEVSPQEMDISEGEDETLKATTVVESMLEDTEDLGDSTTKASEDQQQPGPSKGKGKRKAPKKMDVFEALANIQKELQSLKRKSDEDSRQDNKKVRKIDTEGVQDAYVKTNSGKQLSSVSVKKQLSSANEKQQLSSATTQRLSTVKGTKQLRTVKKPVKSVVVVPGASACHQQQDEQDEEEDAIDLQVNDDNDPLQHEVRNVFQNNEIDSDDDVVVDSSEDDEEVANEEDIFDDIVDSIDIRGEDELPGMALPQTWASKVNLAWKTKISKTTLLTLLKKYPVPSNLTDLKVPRMNKEIWRLIGKWQRKSDLSMGSSQRTLSKAATAVLTLHNFTESLSRSTRQLATQTCADVISMLGKVNQDITAKRKTTIRPCLKGDFKTLSTATKVTENLFGDNLTQDIKDIQVKKKIEDNNSYGSYGYKSNNSYGSRRGFFRGGYSGGYQHSNYRQNYGNTGGHFLWRGSRGRGRPYQRTPYNSNDQKPGQKKN